MDKRRVIITGLVILGVIAACLAVIRLGDLEALVAEGILMPVYYSLWLGNLMLHSVDQPILWGIGLALLAAGLVYGFVKAWPTRLPRPRPDLNAEQRTPIHGRVYFWINRVESLRNQGVDSEYANFDFRRLTQSVIEVADDETISASSYPPEVQPFLKKSSRTGQSPPAPEARRASFRRLFARWRPAASASPPAGETRPQLQEAAAAFSAPEAPQPGGRDPLDGLCTFLEKELEIEHDDND